MIDMGVKRKELHPTEPATPGSSKDYENEKSYPELMLSGAHAEMMGAADLKEGDVVNQPVRWRVKRHTVTTEGGKTDYRMTLCLEKAGDCVEAQDDKSDEGPRSKNGNDGPGNGTHDKSAMLFIEGRAKPAE